MNNLLEKYFAGTITDSEKHILFQELEKNEQLKKEFILIQNTLAIASMAYKRGDEYWSKTNAVKLFDTIKKRKLQRFSFALLKYAAAAIIVCCTWLISDYYIKEGKKEIKYTYIEVPQGQTVHIVLPDETEVWLKSRTKMKMSDQFNQTDRVVELDGEGFFSVRKNTKMPFIVNTKQYNIEVTGTQFNVFAYSKSPLFETDLVKGVVSVYDKDSKKDNVHYLQPKEKVYQKDGKLLKTVSTFNQTPSDNKNGIYNFENQSFEQILSRLQLWYDIRVTVKNPEILSSSFSGKFRLNDHIENILRAIKETGKFDYVMTNEDEIEIF